MKELAQRDPQWKDIKLGNSNLTIGDYGCCITSLSMLAGLTPIEVNDRLKSVNGFQGALVLWSKIQEAIPWLKWTWRGYIYENNNVLDTIEKEGGCLVEVDFDGNNSRTDDKHWVLFKGNKKMNDPWTGKEESTNKYSPLTGYSVIEVDESLKPSTDDMTQDEKNALTLLESYKVATNHGNLEGALNALIGKLIEIEQLKGSNTNLTNEVNKLRGEKKQLEDDLTSLKSQISNQVATAVAEAVKNMVSEDYLNKQIKETVSKATEGLVTQESYDELVNKNETLTTQLKDLKSISTATIKELIKQIFKKLFHN